MDLFDAGIMMTCRKTYEVISGEDLIKKVVTWDPNTSRYNKPAKGPKYAFDRFCSADLPVTKAFYDAKSGKGTTARIYMNGEEITGGRAWDMWWVSGLGIGSGTMQSCGVGPGWLILMCTGGVQVEYGSQDFVDCATA